MSTIPIKYIGKQPEWHDTIYGSEMTYPRGERIECPAWAAQRILRHPEFVDLRPRAARKPIFELRPEPEIDENEQVQFLEGKVPLQNMTLLDLTTFAMKNFGVRFPDEAPIEQRRDEVRSLVGMRSIRGF